MPQSDVQKQYLLKTLQQSPLTDDQRQYMWDTFTKSTDPKDFVSRVNTFPGGMADSAKQSFYDLRYNPSKYMDAQGNPIQPGAPKAAPTPAPVPASLLEPGFAAAEKFQTQGAQPPQMGPSLSDKIEQTVGKAVPNWAVAPLATANKYLVEPFNKMAAAGAEAGGNIATTIQAAPLTSLKDAALQQIGIAPSQKDLDTIALSKVQTAHEFPQLTGIMQGVGSLVGGTVADPRNWPFLAETAVSGAAKIVAPKTLSTIDKLMARGFGSYMLYNTASTIPAIAKAIKDGDEEQAASLITQATAGAALGGVSLSSSFRKPITVLPDTTTSTTTPTVASKEIPVEIAPHPEAQLLAKSPEIPVSESAIPNLHPEEKAALESQAGRALSTEDAQKLRLRNVQAAAVQQALTEPKPVDIIAQMREQSIPAIAPEPIELKSVEAPVQEAAEKVTASVPSAQSAVNKSNDAIDKLIDNTPPTQYPQLHDALLARALNHTAKSNTIHQLVDLSLRNEANAKAAVELRSTGGPIRDMVMDAEGNRAIVKPTAEVGPFARRVLDKAQGREPRAQLSDDFLRTKPNGVTDEAWNGLMGKLKAKYTAQENQILSSIDHAQETQQHLEDTDIPQQLKELDETGKMIWKIPDAGANPGRRPHLPPPIDAEGNITNPGSLWTMDVKTSEKLLETNRNQIATPEELLAKATEHENAATMLSNAAKRVTARMNSQRGAIGEQRFVSSLDTQLPDTEFKGKALAARAKRAGLPSEDVSKMDKPLSSGLYSADGKTFVPVFTTHAETIQALYPEVASSKIAAMRMAFDRGIMRKSQYNHYEMARFTDALKSATEMDMFKSNTYGRHAYIDIGNPYADEPKLSIELEPGWDKLHSNLGEAVQAAIHDAKRIPGNQRGALTRSGVVRLSSANIGAGIFGIIGVHVAGPVGGMVGAIGGWGIGFLTPDLLRSPIIFDAMSHMKPMLDSIGISASDWLRGKAQPEPILPRMKDIINQQHADIQGSHLGIIQRIASIPNDIRRAFLDKLVLANDQHSALGNYLHRLDPNARFLNPQGRPSLDDSPYVSLYTSATSIRGEQAFNHIQYTKIFNDAKAAGLSTHLDEYLNLRAYNRTFRTLTEHAQNFGSQISADTNALKDPSLSPADRVHLEDRIAGTRKLLKDTLNTIQSGKAVPANYTIDTVAKDTQLLHDTLGPDKMQQIRSFAQRIYDRNRAALDFLHDHGVISDANYQLFISRGNDYIPMSRIMSDLANDSNRWNGPTSPAYLRKQNVIHAIEGSERVNRSPIVASESWNNEAISEAIRNSTIGDFVKMAKDHPDFYSDSFKEVDSAYKAKTGEILVGHYINGEPHTYAVPKLLGETLQNTTPVINDIIGGVTGRFIMNAAKTGATTLNLGFSLMRPLTDLARLATLSEGGVHLSSFPKDLAHISQLWIKSLADTMTRNQAWQEAIRQGYTFSSAQRNITPEAFLPAQKLGWTGKLNPVRIIHGVADFSAAIEDSIKMTAFRRLKEQGWSDKAAKYETMRYGGAPDYSRSGNLSATANILTMFFNADIQHITQAYARLSENPKRLVPILGSLTAATMILSQHNWAQKDENGQPLMRRVPYEVRDRDFIFLTGDTTQTATGATVPVYYRMRKPDFAVLFINPMENMLNKLSGREDRTGTQLAIDAIQHSTPFTGSLVQPTPSPITAGQLARNTGKAVVASLNPIARIPIEEMLNERMYGGSPIATKTNIEPQYQFGPATSTAAKDIGAKLNISPQRVEHVLQGFTGGASNMVTSALEPYLRPGGAPPNIAGTPEGRRVTPVIGSMLGRFQETATNQQEVNLSTDFYSRAQDAIRQYQTFQSLVKSNPSQAMTFAQSHQDSLWKSRLATNMSQKLGQIDQMQRQVESEQGLTPEARRDMLKNLYNAKMEILKAFDGVLKTVPAQGLDTGSQGIPKR